MKNTFVIETSTRKQPVSKKLSKPDGNVCQGKY